ncbi:MAG: cytochrome c [Verrucomicrobiales bacterium]|nr:cytochrome c [Verrucomicrobiales bacterium]
MSTGDDRNLDYESGTASVVDMHDSVRREKILQPSGAESLGLFPLVLCGLVLIAGGGFLFKNANGFSDSTYINSDYRPDPKPVTDDGDGEAEEVAWIDSWMKEGKKVYGNCAACHQPTGTGAPGMFPPLTGSEWVDGGTARLGAILVHGINGPMTVAGQSYNQLMPAWGTLSDKKIAQVITYVRREFGSLPEGDDGVVTTEMVAAARDMFKSQSGPFTEAQLKAIPEDKQLPGAKVDLQTGDPL